MDFTKTADRYDVLEAEFTRLWTSIADLPKGDPRTVEPRARLAEVDAEIQQFVRDAGPNVCFLPCCNPHPGDIPRESDEQNELGVVLQGKFRR